MIGKEIVNNQKRIISKLKELVGLSGGGASTEAKQDAILLAVNNSGTIQHELRTTARTFITNEIKEFSFKVISGTVDVTIGGNLVAYPLSDGTSGFNDLKNNSGLGEIIITPATESSILLMYKLV